jgi:hypothetical protein
MKRKMYIYMVCTIYFLFYTAQIASASEWLILFFYPECSYTKFKGTPCSATTQFMGNNHYSGVYASYAGYIEVSDHSGQIRFPRKHQGDSLSVLVAPKISPIFLQGKTIHHFEVELMTPYAFYEIKQIKDSKTKKMMWDVSEKKLVTQRAIPYDTLILFAKPDQIKIPLGKHEFMKGSQLILPKMYTSATITNNLNAIQVLTIRQFFSPLVPLYKTGEQEVTVQLSY